MFRSTWLSLAVCCLLPSAIAFAKPHADRGMNATKRHPVHPHAAGANRKAKPKDQNPAARDQPASVNSARGAATRSRHRPQTQISVRPLTPSRVYVTSSRDLSNVELRYYDGSRQRFENLQSRQSTFSGTGPHAGKRITTVWVKSGPNFSGDGPGLGERFDLPASSRGRGEEASQETGG